MEQEKLTGQATDEQIKAWKEKHEKVFFTKAEGHIAYFRKPDRKELDYSLSMKDSNPLKADEAMLKSCFLGGSSVFTTDVGFMIGASGLIEKLIAIKEAELGEL
ncbi:MAG: hypothetical protein FWC34_09050 [Bacteroidetes bacterium]|nr:hypothetical protein [Bacteroidota bacterium]